MSEHDYDVLLVDFNLGPEFGTRLLDEIGAVGPNRSAFSSLGLPITMFMKPLCGQELSV